MLAEVTKFLQELGDLESSLIALKS
jgi:hypothetical protein